MLFFYCYFWYHKILKTGVQWNWYSIEWVEICSLSWDFIFSFIQHQKNSIEIILNIPRLYPLNEYEAENSSESIIYVMGLKLLPFWSIKCPFNIFLCNGSKKNYYVIWNFLVYSLLLCIIFNYRSFILWFIDWSSCLCRFCIVCSTEWNKP